MVEPKLRAPLRLGMIGLGAIGTTALEAIEDRQPGAVNVVGALVRDALSERAGCLVAGDACVSTIEQLLARGPELIIECAGQSALSAYGPAVLRAGVDLLVVSTGALADVQLWESLLTAAHAGGGRVRVASGAVGALDWLTAAKLGGISEVVYRLIKPPRAWEGTDAPTPKDGPVVFYRSSVREAAARYPKNVNAAASVALATLGFDRTQLELVADPSAERNIHEVEARGAVGTLKLRLENLPDASNPRTSWITGLSVAQTLLRDRAAFAI